MMSFFLIPEWFISASFVLSWLDTSAEISGKKLFRQNFSEFDISNAVFEKVSENRLPVYRKGPAKTGTWISAFWLKIFHTKIVARRLFIRYSKCSRD